MLYNDLVKRRYRRIRNGKDELVVMAPIVGKRYGTHQDVRLMWVGRAVNGWTPVDLCEGETAFLSKVFDESAREDRYHFLRETYSDKRAGPYYLTSSFWRVSKLVCEKLFLPPDEDGLWAEHLVWANLYAAAPSGGNPGKTLCDAQRSVCRDILLRQIELARPTHLVFVTGWDWFDEFNGAGPKRLFAEAREPVSAEGPVVWCGQADNMRIAVTERPEFRYGDQCFAEAVCSALESLSV